MSDDEPQWEAHFVENMAQRRKEIGMTQASLARHLSAQGLAFHQQTVQRIENGERPVRLNEAVLIVQALGMGEPGKLGLDSAIDPQLSEAIAHYLLKAAIIRAQQLTAATELNRSQAADRVMEALRDIGQTLEGYVSAVGERDADLIAQAHAELDFFERYWAGLRHLAGLHLREVQRGERPEAT